MRVETYRNVESFIYNLHNLVKECHGFCRLDLNQSIEFDREYNIGFHVIKVRPFLADGRSLDDKCYRLTGMNLRIDLDIVYFNKYSETPFFFLSAESYAAISAIFQIGIGGYNIFYDDCYFPSQILDLNKKNLLRLKESLKKSQNFIFSKYYRKTRFFQSDEVKKFKKQMQRLIRKRDGVDVFDFVKGNLEDEYLNALRMVKTIKKFDKIDNDVHQEINKILDI